MTTFDILVALACALLPPIPVVIVAIRHRDHKLW